MKNKTLYIVISIALFYLITTNYIFGMTCPFKIATGLSCPGCGMTRAIMSCIHFNLSEAFYFHPLFFTFPIIIFLVFKIITGHITKMVIRLTISIVLLFITVYMFRIYLQCEVLTFDFCNGLLYQLLHNIIK